MLRGADGSVPPPKGYDISGSAAWFAKADLGITVHSQTQREVPYRKSSAGSAASHGLVNRGRHR
jgi:hypothetical protein